MMGAKAKIMVAVLAGVIVFPLEVWLASSTYFSIVDKTNGAVVSSGVTRRYLLYVPASYDRSRPTPLVISIHPAATWGVVQMRISRWNELAEQYGFIVVYPNGSGAFFDGFSPGPHIWPGEEDLPRDVRFISDLIDKLEGEYNIDPKLFTPTECRTAEIWPFCFRASFPIGSRRWAR